VSLSTISASDASVARCIFSQERVSFIDEFRLTAR
jgi:hypothetical protein